MVVYHLGAATRNELLREMFWPLWRGPSHVYKMMYIMLHNQGRQTSYLQQGIVV